MKKDKFNTFFREYARTLSPSQQERAMIGDIYQSFNDLLGNENCIQIGSYPRFTSITPVHDLDILYIVGDWQENQHDPSTVITDLINEINGDYVKPSEFDEIKVSSQTHSVTISFIKSNSEIFSVDVVPAFRFGINEFRQSTYKIPEIIKKKSHTERGEYYKYKASIGEGIDWIKSDPCGYIKIASIVGKNSDFRKAVKLVKKWKNNLCEFDEELKLKSFHVEQVMTEYFKENSNLEVFDAIFLFFVDFTNTVLVPNRIQDRANSDKYIDDYIGEFTQMQIAKIKKARDGFLIKLENFDEINSVEELFQISIYERPGSERFLFDLRIPVLTDDNFKFDIYGEVQERPGFRKFILTKLGRIDVDRKIRFRVKGSPPKVDLLKWKVKNDDACGEPRGEITDHRTRNDPENAKFKGNHYVECYAIESNVCVAIARQDVVLGRLS